MSRWQLYLPLAQPKVSAIPLAPPFLLHPCNIYCEFSSLQNYNPGSNRLHLYPFSIPVPITLYCHFSTGNTAKPPLRSLLLLLPFCRLFSAQRALWPSKFRQRTSLFHSRLPQGCHFPQRRAQVLTMVNISMGSLTPSPVTLIFIHFAPATLAL